MEITKREILVSVVIIAVMAILGINFVGWWEEEQIQRNSEYNSALQITDSDQFKYCMNTSAGNAFVYGNLRAAEPVKYSDIDGEYLCVRKVEEHYNLHTRTITVSDGNGRTHTRTQTYWSWDFAGEEEKHSSRIIFCDVELDYEKIQMPLDKYIDTVKISREKRFVYYGVPDQCIGTIYTDLREGSISDNSRFWINTDIDSALQYSTTSSTYLIWMMWILLTGGIICGFCELDNRWLND